MIGALSVCPVCNRAVCGECAPEHPCELGEGRSARTPPLALWGVFPALPPVKRWAPGISGRIRRQPMGMRQNGASRWTPSIERGHDGRAFTKATQIFLCGNSVPPVMAEAIVRANLASREEVAA